MRNSINRLCIACSTLHTCDEVFLMTEIMLYQPKHAIDVTGSKSLRDIILLL